MVSLEETYLTTKSNFRNQVINKLFIFTWNLPFDLIFKFKIYETLASPVSNVALTSALYKLSICPSATAVQLANWNWTRSNVEINNNSAQFDHMPKSSNEHACISWHNDIFQMKIWSWTFCLKYTNHKQVKAHKCHARPFIIIYNVNSIQLSSYYHHPFQ